MRAEAVRGRETRGLVRARMVGFEEGGRETEGDKGRGERLG